MRAPKPPSNLNDPQRRLWLASNPAGGYRHGRINIEHVPSRGSRHKMFDRAAREQDALFGHQASRLADRESFEHRFDDAA